MPKSKDKSESLQPSKPVGEEEALVDLEALAGDEEDLEEEIVEEEEPEGEVVG